MWVSTVPAQNTEGLPKCLAGSAGTLIKQLSVGTKLSTLTPRDIKPKESFVDVTFSTFLAEIMHKRSEAFQIIYLSSLQVSFWHRGVRWEPRENKKTVKQAETEWKKGCRQDLHAAILLPQCLWKISGGTKSGLWIRDVDRRESGQQGCSTESGWRYAVALRGSERNAEG